MRGHFHNRHGQAEEALLKSERKHVEDIYWWLWRQLGRKKCPLLICKVLKLFVKALWRVCLHRTLWEAAWWTATSTVQIWRTPPLIVFDHCEGNSVGENLSYWYEMFQKCFLRHWLAVTTIPFVIETIYSSHFRCSYLKNNKSFLNFFFPVLKSKLNFEHFTKKEHPPSLFISEITDAQKGV